MTQPKKKERSYKGWRKVGMVAMGIVSTSVLAALHAVFGIPIPVDAYTTITTITGMGLAGNTAEHVAGAVGTKKRRKTAAEQDAERQGDADGT